MTNLQQRQEKIQEKRKQTPRCAYVKEIASWYPLTVHKNHEHTSVFPPTERAGNITSVATYAQEFTDTMYKTTPEQGDFFENFASLFRHYTKPATIQFGANENSDFANCVFRAKNAYLSFIVGETCENVLYSSVVYSHCSNIYNAVCVTNNSHNVYSAKGVSNSFNIFFSLNIHNSSDIWGSSNLIGCHHCINCHDLKNQSYCIENKVYDKTTYEQKKANLNLQEISGPINERGANMACESVQGEGLFACSEVEHGYYATRLERGRNVYYIGSVNGCSDFYDVFEAGVNSSHFYGVCNAGTDTHHVYCSSLIDTGCQHIFYSYHLETCSYCLGCIGLKNKSYCIFNKQYTKEERHQKVDEIFTQMEQEGVIGDFFPGWMNPFYFNDTAASLIEDFTKEEVEAEGYLRRDEEIAVDIPEWMEVVEVGDLGQYEGRKKGDVIARSDSDVAISGSGDRHASLAMTDATRWFDPAILKKVIRDEEGNVYRVIKMEYDFLVKYGLPLPRKHWLDRLKGHFRVK